MERIQTSLTGINSTRLQLGFEGEQNHTRVVIYCTQIFNEYPVAVASMVIKPPTGDIYPKVLIRDGMKVIWDATAADCAIPGNGQYQLTFTNGDEIIKTYIGEYTVLRSLIGSGDPPDPVEDWLQEAQAALAAFDQNVTDAEAWAVGTRDGEPVESTDPAYHNNSKYYADQAEEVLESIPPDYTALSADVAELHVIKADVIVSSAGPAPIVSIPDGADNMPVKTLTVGIEPVQDLHGQDAPYPAGGGKNVLDADGYYFTTETGTDKTTVIDKLAYLEAGTEYTFSCRQTGNAGTAIRNLLGIATSTGTTAVAWETSNNPSAHVHTVTYTPSESRYYRPLYWAHTLATAVTLDQFQCEKGSAFTSFAPYSNICPISGHSSVTVTRTGVNLLTPLVEGYWNGQTGEPVSSSLYWRSEKIKVEPGITYYSKGITIISAWIKWKKNGASVGAGSGLNVSISSDDEYVAFYCAKTAVADATKVQVTKGSTDETIPITGQSVTIPLGQTVYGGTLTIHQDGTGELVVDRAEINLGSLSWGYNPTLLLFNSSYSGIKKPTTDSEVTKALSNVFKTYSVNGIQGAGVANGIAIGKTGFFDGRIVIKDTDYTDGTVFQSALTSMGAKLVCEVAEATSYTLTNQQVIETLKGNNNLFADCGSVSLEYPADTKLYIDGKIAELQALILENISNS